MMLRNHNTACALLAAVASLSSFVALGQTLTLTLTPSQHNGYNISCPGGKDGAIDLTVTGGTPPYTFEWSNLAVSVEDQTTLEAGYYHVEVHDFHMLHEEAEITLTEPDKFELRMEPYEYPVGYNVSCNNCFNGSIDVTVLGGVAPYNYLWQDGATTADRTSLGAGNYYFELTDGNNCVASSEVIYLTEPERNDWTMTGNANTNPGTQYIGTSDNKDVVFKTNGTERFRLLSNGDIKMFGASTDVGPLYRDADGILRAGGPPSLDPLPSSPCALTLGPYPYWETDGNTFQYPQCSTIDPLLGTRSPHPVRFITNDLPRMILTVDGKLGIGTEPPSGAVDQYRLFVEDGIVTRDVLVKLGVWPDFVFEKGYKLMSLEELREYLRMNKHLPGIPSSDEVKAKDGVEIGDLQTRMLKTVEEQTLYILQLEEKYRLLEQRMKELEASQH